MRKTTILIAVLASCAGKQQPPETTPPVPTAPAAPQEEQVSLADVGLDAARLDRSADPCQDFYRFACGGWLDKTAIPADQPRTGTFLEIRDRNEQILHDILEQAAKSPGEDPAMAKLGGFYGGCMDDAAVEKVDLAPLAPLFAATRAVRNEKSLLSAVAKLHQLGVTALFTIHSEQDRKDATRVIASLSQGGLGLPSPEYYTSDDDKMKSLRAAYQAHVERMLVLLGRRPAQARKAAAYVLAMETEMARNQKSRVEMRDEVATYNRTDRAGLAHSAPKLSWDGYFQALGHDDIQALNLPAPKYIAALPEIVRHWKPAQWRDYLDFHIVSSAAPALPKRFVEEDFAFEQKINGQKELEPRWKRCMRLTDRALGELLGVPYVKQAFPGESKTAAETMIHAIVDAFERNLAHVDWMDEPTREAAKSKIAKLAFLIGYPETPKPYDFAVDRGRFLESAMAARRWARARDLDKIGKPVDRKEWFMSPSTVNAYYDANRNQMVFPAGILQRPFYDVRSSVAVDLGAIGMFVGHELTHGFDDQGALYDGDGNMSGWWPDGVVNAFHERTQCVAKYYSTFEPLPGVHVNGELTNGENIADIGGVKLAFEAYRALRQDAPKHIVADGFNEDQQFFLAMGQAWCAKSSDDFLRFRVATNPHSPEKVRVNGTLSSVPAFAEAFSCQTGTPMKPTNVCRVW